MSNRTSLLVAIVLWSIVTGLWGIVCPVLMIASFVLHESRASRDAEVVLLIWIGVYCIGWVVAAVAKVFSAILRYRLWASIPEEYRSVTPGRAVGFWFIPFYSLYWFFVAYPRFVVEASSYSNVRGNYGLAIAFAVLLCVLGPLVVATPILSVLIVPLYVVWLLMTLSMNRQAVACVERWKRTPIVQESLH